MNNQPSDPFDLYLDTSTQDMDDFCAQMEAIDAMSHKIGAKTTRIIRIVFFFLGIVACYIFYQIHDMTQDMSIMIKNMVEMYSNFGVMSKDMSTMTQSVVSMGKDMEGLPTISAGMRTMNSDVRNMKGAVGRMKDNMVSMDREVVVISQGVEQMSRMFVHVNSNMRYIGRNVHEMAVTTDRMDRINPMKMMPFMNGGPP